MTNEEFYKLTTEIADAAFSCVAHDDAEWDPYGEFPEKLRKIIGGGRLVHIEGEHLGPGGCDTCKGDVILPACHTCGKEYSEFFKLRPSS